MKRTALPKIGRPKSDPLNGGFNDFSGFWSAALEAVGKQLVKREAVTPQEWEQFSSDEGDWNTLKSFACDPVAFLDPANKSTANWRDWLCKRIVAHPVLVPLFLGLMREQVAGMSHKELWLFYDLGRNTRTDDQLATAYEAETGRPCTSDQITQARENIYRRVRRSLSVSGVSRTKRKTKRETMARR